MNDPIYYYDLIIRAKLKKRDFFKKTWFISRMKEDELIRALKTDPKILGEAIKNVTKKSADLKKAYELREVRVEILKTITTNV